MKNLIITFGFFICTHFVISQTVVSSCSASDSIKALYMKDADRLALRKIYAQNLTYTDSIVIPQTHTDTVLRALIAVYNATTLPARNTVISQYNIHTFPKPNVNNLRVAADSNLAWMHQLKLGNIPTGNAQVDNLISGYDLTIQNYTNYFGLFSYHIVTFKSDSNYNVQPLTDLFETIPGVAFSETVNIVGDGNDISAVIYPNYVALTYSIGWGDCPSGCIYRHYWKFNVYYDCSVEYAGEYGAAIPIAPTPTISILGSTCTNETLTVTISGANSYVMNNQPVPASQFTLSSPTPTSYIVLASNYAYPALTATASISISIIDCNATSINENKWHSNIAIYPNPANEHFELIVNSDALFRDFNSLSVYNGLGQLMRKEEISFKDGRSIKIKTSELAEGVYSIIISNSNNERLTEKLLISR